MVTNIDNLLRPILVPREARLDSALMLLAVFAGLTMFGAWGIVIGPVLMIVIVTTISVYLAVYKGVPMDPPDEKATKPKRRNPFSRLGRRIKRAHDKAEAKSEESEKADAVDKDENARTATSGAD